jgi:biopolymer transport protein ExbD
MEAKSHTPAVLGEDDLEMEFQVAPMVDVLLVLLLFFMATASTEVSMQREDITLPRAGFGLDIQGRDAMLDVNILSGTFLIEVLGVPPFEEASQLTPIIKASKENAERTGAVTPDRPYRVYIRADSNTRYERIHEIMKASAEAGVPDVSFAINEDKDQRK